MFYVSWNKVNLNKVFLIGRLTQDPEVKTTPSWQMVCNFGLATNRNWTDRGTHEKKEKTEFHNIILWRRLAEIASQYLKKGSLVLIEGRIQTRSWQDASGAKKYKTEIIAENIQLGPKNISQPGSFSRTIDQGQPLKEITQEEIPIIEENYNPPAAEKDAPQETQPEMIKEEEEKEIDVKDIPF